MVRPWKSGLFWGLKIVEGQTLKIQSRKNRVLSDRTDNGQTAQNPVTKISGFLWDYQMSPKTRKRKRHHGDWQSPSDDFGVEMVGGIQGILNWTLIKTTKKKLQWSLDQGYEVGGQEILHSVVSCWHWLVFGMHVIWAMTLFDSTIILSCGSIGSGRRGESIDGGNML